MLRGFGSGPVLLCVTTNKGIKQMSKHITFRATERDELLIESERQRLVDLHHGAPITKADALRSLLGHAPVAKELVAA